MNINDVKIGDILYYQNEGRDRSLETHKVENLETRDGKRCLRVKEQNDGNAYVVYHDDFYNLIESGNIITHEAIESLISDEDLFQAKLAGSLPQLVSEHMSNVANEYLRSLERP